MDRRMNRGINGMAQNVEQQNVGNVDAIEELDGKVIDIYKWKTPATDYPRKECGLQELDTDFITGDWLNL